MTPAECAIVADAGTQLRRLAEILTVPASFAAETSTEIKFVALLDKTALQLSEVIGALSALPLVEA